MWIDPASILNRAAIPDQFVSLRPCVCVEVSEGPCWPENRGSSRVVCCAGLLPGYLLGDLTVWIGDLGCSLGQRAQLYTEAGVSYGLPFCQLFSVYLMTPGPHPILWITPPTSGTQSTIDHPDNLIITILLILPKFRRTGPFFFVIYSPIDRQLFFLTNTLLYFKQPTDEEFS